MKIVRETIVTTEEYRLQKTDDPELVLVAMTVVITEEYEKK